MTLSRNRWVTTLAVILALASSGRKAVGQAGVDLRGRLDASPGGTLLGNRPGPSIGRTPPSAYQRQDVLSTARPDQLAPPPLVPDYPPSYGVRLPDAAGKKSRLGDGMTLDAAIDLLHRQNPDILAARTEVEQAKADIVTAGLRANPQFFADMQQVPYRVLVPGQADVSFAYPVDVSGKRKTRVQSAVCALRSVEWRGQDFLRRQVDNLTTLFVDTLVAQETERFRADELKSIEAAQDEASLKLRQAPKVGPEQAKARLALKSATDKAKDARWTFDDAASAHRDQRLALALVLNLPDPAAIRVQGTLYDPRTFDENDDAAIARRLRELTRIAFANRPDLQAQRWNVCRAVADVEAVRASRFDDVTFLVQPYTYSPALPNRVGWAFGVTIPMPIYNRQQGNLAKAQQIVTQSRAQLTALENTVTAEVTAAYLAVGDTSGDIDRYKEIMSERAAATFALRADRLPADKVAREYLVRMDPVIQGLAKETNRRHEEDYYRALVLHRKSLLRMNTACACTVWGIDPSPLDPPAVMTAETP